MSWKFKVLNAISPRLANRWVYKEANKKLEFIRSVLVPRNQLEFKEIFKPLYDLLSILPDISDVNKNRHHELYIESGASSSNDLWLSLILFNEKDFTRFDRQDLNPLVSGAHRSFRLSSWLSNRESIIELFLLSEKVLFEAIKLDKELQDATNDINKRRPELETIQENFSYYTSLEFKNIILSILKTLDFFMRLYYEDNR